MEHTLPSLPYAIDALAPYYGRETLGIENALQVVPHVSAGLPHTGSISRSPTRQKASTGGKRR